MCKRCEYREVLTDCFKKEREKKKTLLNSRGSVTGTVSDSRPLSDLLLNETRGLILWGEAAQRKHIYDKFDVWPVENLLNEGFMSLKCIFPPTYHYTDAHLNMKEKLVF